MHRIALGGPMGAGKTTVGRALARRLGLPFRDLDELIGDVSAIFAAEGEAGFRARETEALGEAVRGAGVLALGGGALVRPENRSLLAGWRVIVLLAPYPVLAARIGAGQGRPLAIRLAETLRAREGIWPLAGPIVDSSAGSVDEVVDRVLALCC